MHLKNVWGEFSNDDEETKIVVATSWNESRSLFLCFFQHHRSAFSVPGGEDKLILSLLSACFEEIVAETSGTHLLNASVQGVDRTMIYGGNVNQYRED